MNTKSCEEAETKSPFNLKEVYNEVMKVLEEKEQRKKLAQKKQKPSYSIASSKIYFYITCDTTKKELETLLFEKYGLKSRATVREKSAYINVYTTLNEETFEEISKSIIENINHTPPSNGIYYFYCKLNNPQISTKTYDFKTSFLAKDTCDTCDTKSNKLLFCEDSD